jgi:hypothetical protein
VRVCVEFLMVCLCEFFYLGPKPTLSVITLESLCHNYYVKCLLATKLAVGAVSFFANLLFYDLYFLLAKYK